ncbi:MAG: riboflavin synthase [Thermoleophilaceae bacterium]|jgi:riboflavin synthase|nr:riboflavin synthase [Thermoleophilaceae bacterium]
MFTGLVNTAGEVLAVNGSEDGARLEVGSPLATELAQGDSIAVSGVCLTAVEIDDDRFAADVMAETLCVSTLGTLSKGDRVNLELPLRPADRLGGHIVQGHVDGTGTIKSVITQAFARRVTVIADSEICRYVVPRGSVAIDGVSLTAALAAGDQFTVALIPETLKRTTLGDLRPGDSVNVEVDLIAKYVARLTGGLQAELVIEGPE